MDIPMTETEIPDRVEAYLRNPWREWTETYVIANSIGMRGQTPKIRRALRRMEKNGIVVSKPSWRHNMIEWSLVNAIRTETGND